MITTNAQEILINVQLFIFSVVVTLVIFNYRTISNMILLFLIIAVYVMFIELELFFVTKINRITSKIIPLGEIPY